MIYTSQCNNMFIFPGMGLGALVCGATKITHKMFVAASKAVSSLVTDDQCKQNILLPELSKIRQVSLAVAKAIAIEARDSGLARRLSDEEIEALLTKAQWKPEYTNYRPGNGASK
jgi:malate dehydrogenase (oxaloacetate-decarboxylating)